MPIASVSLLSLVEVRLESSHFPEDTVIVTAVHDEAWLVGYI